MRIVVTGTATEVGKTWVASALAAGLVRRGHRCVAMKPVESGGAADARALAEACSVLSSAAPYQFAEAVGPHLAAQHRGIEIDLETCAAWVEQTSRSAELAIVELAGGLLSPLSSHATNADLLRRLAPARWIAVAPDRLGVLHDLKALMLCLPALRLPPPIVVLNAPASPDASSGTNAASLLQCGICEVAASFHRVPAGSEQNEAAVAGVIRALGLTSAL